MVLRREVIFVAISFLMLSMLPSAYAYSGLSGSGVTGGATSQPTNVSIFVAPQFSNLFLVHPINGTYLTNESILLNFTSTPVDNYWYNIDNGDNISISSPLRFNLSSDGTYTLFLYANKSGFVTSANVTFRLNSTTFKVLYYKYKGAFAGSSTDFYDYSYEEMLNLSNIVLENTLYGKIHFDMPVGLPYDANLFDLLLDLDSYTDISYNRIELDSTFIPNFDVEAIIWFYNLTFVNPIVLKDGSPCLSCVIEDYAGGTLRARVSGFSVYNVEESQSPIFVGGGGGSARANASYPLCRTDWVCSAWADCANGSQTRKCVKALNHCEVIGDEPAEKKVCAEEMVCNLLPHGETECPLSTSGCCLLGLCWFKFIVCWYWWVLLLILIVLLRFRKKRIDAKHKVFAAMSRRGKGRLYKLAKKGRLSRADERNVLAFNARRLILTGQIKKLDWEYKRGTLDKKGYKKTRAKLLRKLSGIR